MTTMTAGAKAADLRISGRTGRTQMLTTSRTDVATMDLEEFAMQRHHRISVTRAITFTNAAIVTTTVEAASGTRKTTIGWANAAMITMTTAAAQGATVARITK